MMDWLSMGDYTLYVWSSVGLVCFVLLAMTWRARAQFRQAQKRVAWSKNAQL